MKLNLKFYSGKDEYSDGNVEDIIIDYIKKYPKDYEETFKKDCSWPVFYHLSNMRKNSIHWYPFKKNSSILEVGGGMGALTGELCEKCGSVTTIELSKRRATAIFERNKKATNLEIIVGNFKDIILGKKYDYILLNGVLEYAALYMDSENPYEDFINKLKNNLKPTGKILIAIENKFGLKYWCGANEDHTNGQFDGLNDYPNETSVRTFSKNDLELMAEKCNMNINFYYMFPDYKFPQVIYTNKSLDKGIYVEYMPYYSMEPNLILREGNLFKDIYKNKQIPFFANSYFLELSNKKTDIEIEFVKFNDFRNNMYNIYTFSSNGKYYKSPKNEQASEFFEEYISSNKELLKLGYNVVEVKKDSNGYYTDEIMSKDFLSIICNDYQQKGENTLLENLNKFDEYNKKKLRFIDTEIKEDVFTKYKVKISKYKREKLHYVEKLYIDIIPQNMLEVGNDYTLIDQEWYFKNAPYEFLLYRAISNTLPHCIKNYNKDILFDYLKKFNIDQFAEEFEKLEDSFQLSIHSYTYEIMKKYTKFIIDSKTIKINDLEKLNNDCNELSNKIKEIDNQKDELVAEKTRLENQNKELEKANNDLKNAYDGIINSKRWKITNKICSFIRK